MELQTPDDLFDDPYSDDELDENIALGLALDPDNNFEAELTRERLEVALRDVTLSDLEKLLERAEAVKKAAIDIAEQWAKWTTKKYPNVSQDILNITKKLK